MILWQQGDGYTWIDDGGVAFRPRGAAANLITVQALGRAGGRQRGKARMLSPRPHIFRPTWSTSIKTARRASCRRARPCSLTHAMAWAGRIARGWQAFFGTGAREMSLKLRVYQSLVSSLHARGIAPAFINVQFPTAPYYRMNQ